MERNATARADRGTTARELEIEEHPRVPWLGLVLGYAAMAPLALAAAVALAAPPARAEPIAALASVWAGALLTFLAGVRRGLSFRTEGGPGKLQIATVLGVFFLGVAALLLPRPAALGAALAGFMVLWIADPIAARQGAAPLYFARLRPVQLLVPTASLAVLLVT